MAVITETRCDICGKLLLPTEDGREPLFFSTALKSVRVTMLWTQGERAFDLCPRCFRRMKRYLKKYGDVFDKEEDNTNDAP